MTILRFLESSHLSYYPQFQCTGRLSEQIKDLEHKTDKVCAQKDDYRIEAVTEKLPLPSQELTHKNATQRENLHQ